MGAAPKFAPADVEQWDEAVKWFLARVPMTKERWLKLTAEARRKAFTVAGVAKADVLHDVHKAIDSAIAKGTTLDDFKKTIGAKLLESWAGTVKNPAWRIECLPGDTPVTGAVIRAAHRRWFEGTLIEVVTASGRKFSTTPNHPMLTRRGWVATGDLQEGDDLVGYRGSQHQGALGDDHVAAPPTTIAQLFSALAQVRPPERVDGCRDDFHGDGEDSDVDVARATWDLEFGRFAPLQEPVGHHVFESSDLAESSFCSVCGHLIVVTKRCGFCDASPVAARGFDEPHDGVHARSEFQAQGMRAITCGVAPEDLVSRKVIANIRCLPASSVEQSSRIAAVASDSGIGQHPVHPTPRGADSVGNALRAEPRLVERDHFVSEFFRVLGATIGVVIPDAICNRPGDSSLLNGLVDPHGRRADRLCNAAVAEATAIEFDRVISRRAVQFAGHVFNLSTAHGYFAIDGLYTGNTIFRTNVQQSYSSGRWSQMTDPVVAKHRPFGIFDAILDNRVTARCSELDGTILPWDEWREKGLVPPLHFGCRSGIRSLRKSRAEKMPGWGKATPDVKPQQGFGLPPGATEWKPDLTKYPPDLGKEVKATLKAAPKPAPMPLPTGAKLIEPPTNAIEAAFDVKLKGKLKDEADIAFAAIDAAHAVPNLPRIPMETGRLGKSIEAAYERTKFGGKAIGIKIRAKADHPALSLLHEIGHFLDHQGHNKPGTFLMETAAGRKLLKVLEQSAAAKSIEALQQQYLRLMVERGSSMGAIRSVSAQFEYYLRPKELWARAYAQWVAVKSGNKTLLKQLDAARARKPGLPYIACQWDDDEWKAIAEAIEEHMKEAGWDPT
jgi:SPP1 gp7 family putative phage head morphogenesis protein